MFWRQFSVVILQTGDEFGSEIFKLYHLPYSDRDFQEMNVGSSAVKSSLESGGVVEALKDD